MINKLKRLTKKLLMSILFFTAFTNIQAENTDDTFLVCKGGFNNPTAWKTAFVILSTEGHGKKAKVGFNSMDQTYYQSNKTEDFVRTKEGWAGTIKMREFDLRVSENSYGFSRDDSSYGLTGNKVIVGNVIQDQGVYVPDYESFSINRSDLTMRYSIYNREYQRRHGSERNAYFSCEISNKEDLENSLLKFVDSGWKRGIKAEKKRLDRLGKKKQKIKPKI